MRVIHKYMLNMHIKQTDLKQGGPGYMKNSKTTGVDYIYKALGVFQFFLNVS